MNRKVILAARCEICDYLEPVAEMMPVMLTERGRPISLIACARCFKNGEELGWLEPAEVEI